MSLTPSHILLHLVACWATSSLCLLELECLRFQGVLRLGGHGKVELPPLKGVVAHNNQSVALIPQLVV